MCIALSNFFNRDFYFDCELPCSTPPAYALRTEFKEKFRLLLESPRSNVSQLLRIDNRRVFEIDRKTENKVEFQLLYSHFTTTQDMKLRFEGTIVWDSFSVGRIAVVKEDLNDVDLIEWTHTKLSNPSIFFFLPRREKQALLDSVKIRYLESLERLATRIADDIGPHHSAHIRIDDYLANYSSDGYSIDVERFRKYAAQTFGEDSLPILLATDGLEEKEMLRKIFGDRAIYIDELVFENYLAGYRDLEFTDFNALTIINQLLCASAEKFIGTYRSTFTSIIHRLRQERFGRSDFEFFPDDKVAKLLNGEGRIIPDRHGFFDWNRYSVFGEDHNSMSWMREWDRELSAVDIVEK